MILACNANDAVRSRAARHRDAAIAALAPLPDSDSKLALINLAHCVTEANQKRLQRVNYDADGVYTAPADAAPKTGTQLTRVLDESKKGAKMGMFRMRERLQDTWSQVTHTQRERERERERERVREREGGRERERERESERERGREREKERGREGERETSYTTSSCMKGPGRGKGRSRISLSIDVIDISCQHASAYVSIRHTDVHTSTYVGIRQKGTVTHIAFHGIHFLHFFLFLFV
jgi:hypothetical protein